MPSISSLKNSHNPRMTLPTPLDQYLQMQKLVSHISKNLNQELVTTSSKFNAEVRTAKDALKRKIICQVFWKFNDKEFKSEFDLNEPLGSSKAEETLSFTEELADRVADDVSKQILIEVKREIATSTLKQLNSYYCGNERF